MTPLDPYLPFLLSVVAIGLGASYTNSRITAVKDLIIAENNALRAELRRFEGAIHADIARAAGSSLAE